METSAHNRFSYWWISLLLGLLFLILGALIIKRPLESFYALSIFMGIPLLISGSIEMYFAFNSRKVLIDWTWYLLAGVVDFLIGLFLITNPQIILIIVTVLVGLWLISRGIMIIRKSIQLKEQRNKNWIWVLVIGLLMLASTVLLILKPSILGTALAFWIGITFILLGAYRVYLAFLLRKN